MSQIRSKGFTLIELAIAMVLIGLITLLAMPYFSMFMAAREQAYQYEQAITNHRISQGMLVYARQVSSLGTLPEPFTGSGYTSTVTDPADTSATALMPFLLEQGVSPALVNDDGTAARNVRVYQRLTGITQSVPLYFRGGPLVELRYDLGVLYGTRCPISNSAPACNPVSETGLPGASTAISTDAGTSHYSTWSTSGSDLPPAFVSTLPLQQDMLRRTVANLEKVEDGLIGSFRTKMLAAAAGSTENFLPRPTGTGAPDYSGRSPGANQGCRDGWYPLDSASVNILTQIGLSQGEMSATAWGGRIEYCRDYDPANEGANVPPHFGALRFHWQISRGLPPDSAAASNNVFVTF